jgi:hypothetical protein
LVVDRQWRNTNLLGLLIMEAFRSFIRSNQRFNFAYCSPSLVPFYEQLGMRRYKDNFFDSELGLRIPMVLIVGDKAYINAVRSPFRRVIKEAPQDTEAVDWFISHFPPKTGMVPARVLRENDLWMFFQDRLHDTEIPLFKGLSETDISEFLKAATIINCKAGERVVQRGEVGREMFLILKGGVEVRFYKGGQEHTLASFGKGQIFGEMAFVSEMPRSADVVATSNVELMIINQRFLEKMIKKSPQLSSRVLMNLSVVLCKRLNATTIGWLESSDYFKT